MALSKIQTNSITDGNITTAKMADTAVHGYRNFIINGGFDVWQRGTSSTTHGYGSADRWFHYTSGTGLTYIRSTDVPSNSGLHYSITSTGTPTDQWHITQGIELPAVDDPGVFYNGQTITISYWAKSSVSGDRLWNAIFFRTAVASSSGQVVVDYDTTDNNLLTTSWQRFSKTYTIGVDPANSCNQLAIGIRTRNNAEDGNTPAGNIFVAGVQLELGSEATPFEHRPYADELLRCQRYYYKLNPGTRDYVPMFGDGNVWRIRSVDFPVTMHSIPACSITATPASGASFTSSMPQVENASTQTANCRLDITPTSEWVRLSTFTADAEL